MKKDFNQRKGIILAGGHGTRLSPLTDALSKQLLPIFDKPMIFYPLTTLMLAKIKEILIITTPFYKKNFKQLLGNGKQLGMHIEYKIQAEPKGIADAFLIAEEFINDQNVALILGDNLFHGNDMISDLEQASSKSKGATIFTYPVKDPERYGIVEFDSDDKPIRIIEKPNNPQSNYAVTGIYFYDNSVIKKTKTLKPSKRGELEITDINSLYLKEKLLTVTKMGRGNAWLDTGTFESLHDAGSYIRTLQNRQGLIIGSPEEIAWRNKWISNNELRELAESKKNKYKDYLLNLIS
tara:strand:+ start:237 stop:1118 length:882 start_codon:yes stop_codon:yes gene_type:complete